MHWLWNFFLAKRQFSWLFIIALCVAGAVSVMAIPKESSPEVIVPIGIVQTMLPGASPADVEELITNKLENSIANVEGLEKLTSSSQEGVSSITAEFDANADVDKSIQDLKDAVDQAKGDLPSDATEPAVFELNFTEQPILVVSVSSELAPVAFTELGRDLEDEFESVSGVSKVDVTGTRPREIQILVRGESLQAYGITLSEVSQALASSNVTLPVGTIVTEGIEYSVRLEGKLLEVDEIASIPVTSRGGTPVYIRDVADVVNSVEKESTISRVSVEGAPSEKAMTLSIYKRSGVDVTTMADAVHEKLEEMKKEGGLLVDSQVLVVFDYGKDTKDEISELVGVGLETVVLVMICLLLTIGWRESLVAALSIPLSFVIAFIGLYASGNTINFVSLFALILAIGILVDSGIVITEAIHTRMRKYKDPDEAARASIKEYAWPLIGGTMVTVAVFFPLFFLSGIVGKFISSIPFTIIFVLLASVVVALGMVPLIAIYLTKHSSSNRFEEMQEEYTHKAQAWYRAQLVRFLENRKAQFWFILSLIIALIVALILPFTGALKVIFFPPEDVDYVFVDIEAKQGTPVTQTDLAVRKAEEVLYEKPYVESFASTAGSGSSFTGSGGNGGRYGNITVTLKKDRTEGSAEIAADLRKTYAEIKDAKVTITELETGPTSGAPVTIRLIGDDLTKLAVVAARAESVLRSIPGTRDVDATTNTNATEIVFTIDRAKATAAGVSPFAIGEILRSAVFGTNATTFSDAGDDVDVTVRLETNQAATDPSATPEISLDTLRNLSIPTQTGNTVLLGSILNEELHPAHIAINHEDQERVESVTSFTEGKTTAAEIVTAFQARESELDLPEGIRVSYGGETEDMNKSFIEMMIAFFAGLVLMLAILVLAFNSVRYSLYLLSAIPLSLIGVIIGLTITGQSLSFTSILGVIALGGVIINHAIILMDSMIHHTKIYSGSLIDAVADSAVSRFRPILLTTITTVVGMIPLSGISDFWSPLAFSIMFGLSFAMILTLVLVPTLYYRNEKRKLDKAMGIHHEFWIKRLFKRVFRIIFHMGL
jgi:multidrug efflux pump subunit AcrB